MNTEKLKTYIRRFQAAREEALFGEKGGFSENLHNLLEAQTKYKKTIALFSLFRSCVPDKIFHNITQGDFIPDRSKMPIDPTQYVLQEDILGEGDACRVYKLSSKDPKKKSLVIKLERYIGTVDDLVEQAKKIKSEYEEIQNWYASIPDFIPEEWHVIAKTPMGRNPMIVTIQTFLGDRDCMRDIFCELSPEDLLHICRTNNILKRFFQSFADITLKHFEEEKRVVDVLGNKNVCFVEDEKKKFFILLDPHLIFDLKNQEIGDKTRRKILERIQYLENIKNSLCKDSSDNDASENAA